MAGAFTGAMGRRYGGDKDRARQLTHRARVLAQYLLDSMKRGGYGQLARSEQQPDG